MYKGYCEQQIAKDMKMLEYFVKTGDQKKANMVKDMITIIKQELAESWLTLK